jgi:hypothetical protein
VKHPWEIPASALLNPEWNEALDLASLVPVSPAKVAAVWQEYGADRVLARLRRLAVVSETAAKAGDAA